jgi:hypothetical protein
MSLLDQIATRIIKEQELVIGPLAWTEAEKVHGLRLLHREKAEVVLGNGDPKTVADLLVGRYERLFGATAHQVCRDAVAGIIAELPLAEIPSSLRAL